MTADNNTDFSNWMPRERPGAVILQGRLCQLEPFEPERHLDALFTSICGPDDDDIWTYMPEGPFPNAQIFAGGLARAAQHLGWRTMVIRRLQDGALLGMASFMRNRPEHGSTEVGCVAYSHQLQRTTIATEAIYLMCCHVFDDLGYRRFEWKCNNENAASHAAAKRFGFAFEGIFRNDMIVRGKNRDTAWYAMTDGDWPHLKAAFEAWLSPDNFNDSGKQLKALQAFQ